jgi:hypothetical protein
MMSKIFIFIIVLIIFIVSIYYINYKENYKNVYFRGTLDKSKHWQKVCKNKGICRGDPKMTIQVCPSNYEKEGALCYEKCKPGFMGIGDICWQNCEQLQGKYLNNGTTCRQYIPMDTKPRDTYFRNSRFVAVKCPNGYDKIDSMCYKQCKPGYFGGKILCYHE